MGRALSLSAECAVPTNGATTNTLQGCTSCHAAYRQEVVDDARLEELTSGDMPAPGGHMPGHGRH